MLALFIASIATNSVAEEPNYPDASYDHKFHFVASIGVKNGGDSLQQVVEVSTGEIIEKLRVGGFVHANVGVLFPLGDDSNFSIQMTGGYIFDEISSNISVNDRASFSRYTAELIPFYNFGRQRIGIGVTAHFEPEFEQNASIGNLLISFDDAVGGFIQYDVMYDQSISAGLRFDYIEYEVPGFVLEAPSIGVHVTFNF
jgi:hypothetical protein